MTKKPRMPRFDSSAAHDFEELGAGLVELDEVAFAAEHGGGGAEIAAQRAAHGRDQRGIVQAGDGRAAARPWMRGPMLVRTCGCRIGGFSSSPRNRRIHRTPSPRTTWSASTHRFKIGHIGEVPADDDRRVRLMLADQPAHPPHLEQVGDDRADPDDVVLAAS